MPRHMTNRLIPPLADAEAGLVAAGLQAYG